MILVDFMQVSISNMMMNLQMGHVGDFEEDMCRHQILSSLRGYIVRFSKEFGELVITTEGSNLWRKDLFPYYKANRKAAKDDSPIDWDKLHEIVHKIEDELKKYFPFKFMRVNHCEADDVIGILCHHFGTNTGEEYGGAEPQILIISGDKDFRQLQKFANVKQYSPTKKEFLIEDKPQKYLKEHIIRGDAGDGIPNFLTRGNIFVTEGRQKPIYQKKLDEWIYLKPEDFCDETTLPQYQRNRKLIDLSLIPELLVDTVNEEYNIPKVFGDKDKTKLQQYFVDKGLTSLSNQINDFIDYKEQIYGTEF